MQKRRKFSKRICASQGKQVHKIEWNESLKFEKEWQQRGFFTRNVCEKKCKILNKSKSLKDIKNVVSVFLII